MADLAAIAGFTAAGVAAAAGVVNVAYSARLNSRLSQESWRRRQARPLYVRVMDLSKAHARQTKHILTLGANAVLEDEFGVGLSDEERESARIREIILRQKDADLTLDRLQLSLMECRLFASEEAEPALKALEDAHEEAAQLLDRVASLGERPKATVWTNTVNGLREVVLQLEAAARLDLSGSSGD